MKNVRYGARVIAFLLIVGGLLGILTSSVTGVHFAQQHQDGRVASTIVSRTLFAWSVVTGVLLWRGKPRGFQWATFLFALQVPVFGLSRVVYEFSTFFSLRVMLGDTSRHVGADIGSSSNLYLSPQPVGMMLGINIIAVIALWYLIRESRRRAALL
jgi:hypothetical protein